jgi:hypothetical protein
MIRNFWRDLQCCGFLVFIVLLTSGCASHQSSRQKLRHELTKKNYDEAFKLIETNSFKDDNSKLLYFLEKGMVFHDAGKYYSSLKNLEKAKDVAQELFTVALSKKFLSGLTNDTFDSYYGARYERSLIFFYLCLNRILISQNGEWEEHFLSDIDASIQKGSEFDKLIPKKILTEQEKKRELVAARSELLLWDSQLTTNKEDKRGDSVFKDDLMAKIFGGHLHEMLETQQDNQIALQLYKDAKDLILKNYNSYLTFNQKSKDFKKDFKNFQTMDVKDVINGYIQPTTYQTSLLTHIDENIKSLSTKINNNNNNNDNNLGIVLQWGLIAEKVPDVYNISLETLVNNIEDPETKKLVLQIGLPILAYFVQSVLGLGSNSPSVSPSANLVGTVASYSAVALASIGFELPKIENKPTTENFEVEFLDKKNNLAVVKSVPLFLVNPLGDIAEEAVAEESTFTLSKAIVRVGVKHITAILASYGTYKMMGGGQDNLYKDIVAKSAAIVQYTGASRLIMASEKADTRYWSTLPQDLRMTNLSLPKGDYLVRLKMSGKDKDGGSIVKEWNTGDLIVTNPSLKIIYNIRL